MAMNIYKYEFRASLRGTLLWSLALAAIAGMMLSLYPTFNSASADFEQLLSSFPEAVLNGLAIQIDMVTSLLGFYNYIFLYILLCGAIQAIQLGLSIVSKETREKTADFLLTKPVTRGAILRAKLGAALTSLLLTNVIYLIAASGFAMLVQTEEYNRGHFILISLTLLFIQLIFLSLGFAVAVLFPRIRTVLPVALGTVFTFFAISFISASTGDSKLRFLTPFQYMDRTYIMQHGHYEWGFVTLGAMLFVVGIGVCFLRYTKRDVMV